MAAEVNSGKPLYIKRIHLTNGDTLEDKNAFIVSGFLIVAADNPEQAPTWYNLQCVEVLQEVTVDARQGAPQPRLVHWL